MDGITNSFTSIPFKIRWWAIYNGFEYTETNEMPHHEAMSDIYTAVMVEQPEKAFPPMDVTQLGMVTEVRPEQLRKAVLPIPVTE